MCGWRTSLLRREYTVVNDVAATASTKYLRNVIVLPSRCRVVARARTAGSAESLLTSSSKSFGNDVSDDSQRGRRFDSGSRRIAGLDWASPKLVTLRCDAGAMDIFSFPRALASSRPTEPPAACSSETTLSARRSHSVFKDSSSSACAGMERRSNPVCITLVTERNIFRVIKISYKNRKGDTNQKKRKRKRKRKSKSHTSRHTVARKMGTSVLRSIVRQSEIILYKSYAAPPLRVALLHGRVSPESCFYLFRRTGSRLVTNPGRSAPVAMATECL